MKAPQFAELFCILVFEYRNNKILKKTAIIGRKKSDRNILPDFLRLLI